MCKRLLSNNAKMAAKAERAAKKMMPPGWIEAESSRECRGLPEDTELIYDPINLCDNLAEVTETL